MWILRASTTDSVPAPLVQRFSSNFSTKCLHCLSFLDDNFGVEFRPRSDRGESLERHLCQHTLLQSLAFHLHVPWCIRQYDSHNDQRSRAFLARIFPRWNKKLYHDLIGCFGGKWESLDMGLILILAQKLISNKVLAGTCRTCSAWLTRELNENNFNFNSSKSNEKMEISVKMQHLNQFNKYENSTLLNILLANKDGKFHIIAQDRTFGKRVWNFNLQNYF